MENFLCVTGNDFKQLLKTIELVYLLVYFNITTKGIKYWGEDDKWLYLSQTETDVCNNKFPCSIYPESLIEIVKQWLSKFDIIYTGGEGSHARGWTVCTANSWQDKCDIKIQFQTLYYGK